MGRRISPKMALYVRGLRARWYICPLYESIYFSCMYTIYIWYIIVYTAYIYIIYLTCVSNFAADKGNRVEVRIQRAYRKQRSEGCCCRWCGAPQPLYILSQRARSIRKPSPLALRCVYIYSYSYTTIQHSFPPLYTQQRLNYIIYCTTRRCALCVTSRTC